MLFLVLSLFVIAIVIASVAWNRWNQKRVEEAANWPTTEATINSAEFQEFQGSSRREIHLYPCFEFYYVVNGDYYSGRFGLAVEGEPADRLSREMIDKKLTVSYKSTQPSKFYIPDEMMNGYEVLQKLSARGTSYPSD
jgi:hypothetical protein